MWPWLTIGILFASPPCVTSSAATLPALTVGDQAVLIRAHVARAVFNCGRSDHVSSDRQQDSVNGTW